MNRRSFLLSTLAASAGGCAAIDDYVANLPARIPDVPAIMSPDFMVDAMLNLAEVRAGDMLYDLGCGDGRIVIAAAQRGARGVGVDIDPRQIRLATAAATTARVSDRVNFVMTDLFTMDLRDATVVSLYLGEEINIKLAPRLKAQLRPGTRIVSHQFGMDTWEPETRLIVGGRYLYRWVI